jgi:uncharacterized protein (TIGR00297 family)
MNILLGFLLAVCIAAAAWKAGSLSISGALAAVLLGTVIFGMGGLGWSILLLAFFTSSSVLSRLFKRQKAGVQEKFSKGSQRDAGQVLANGGAAGLCVLLHVLFPGEAWPWAAFAGALAAANADTWATELGVLSRTRPRLITTGQVVETGTSGGITLAGTAAAMGGSFLIASLAVILWQGNGLALALPVWLIWILLSGTAGSLLDSLLGATLQAIYYCPACHKETERYPEHTCGTPTRRIKGQPWMDNDWVNGLCTLAGALLAAAGGLIFF